MGGLAYDGFGPCRRMVQDCRFGPCRQMVRPTSLKTASILNSAMSVSAHIWCCASLGAFWVLVAGVGMICGTNIFIFM